MNRIITTPAAVLVVVALMVATGASATTSQRAGENFTVKRSDMRQLGGDFIESIDLLFNVEGSGKLLLGTTLGSVNVHTWSHDKIRLVVDKRVNARNELDARRLFGMFHIQALHGEQGLQFTALARTDECKNSMGVTFNVWIPKTYDLDVKTDSGNIDIPEMGGRFTAHTSDGKISVDCDTESLDIEVEDRTRGDREDDSTPAQPKPETSETSKPGSQGRR